ncbi:MAG TPA: sialidase family protein [Candidatus Polarisedimenticolaceae bacterium]
MRIRGCSLLVALISAVLGACRTPPDVVREIEPPAAPGSAEPSVETGADGRVYLSWIEPVASGGHALRFAAWEGTRWSGARTVAHGTDWFVNWADFPSLAVLEDGTLAAHWLRKTGAGPYAYAVSLSFSRDGGRSWSSPLSPHDASPTEHGFVSKVPIPGGRIAAVWLDGRETGAGHEGHSGPMTLRSAIVAASGEIERADLIDGRVCDCCQTAAVRAGDGGLVVAYRDRSEGEIRDIAVSRFDGERWSEPRVVHDDGWKMPGCPVNGPALAAAGDRVWIAWFTAPGEEPTPRVRVAASRDGGRTFGPPSDVDAGRPAGRVDLAAFDDGSALVTWIDDGRGASEILARRVTAGGALGPLVRIASTPGSRAAGFPRSAAHGPDVLVAWTEPGDPSRIRTARLGP